MTDHTVPSPLPTAPTARRERESRSSSIRLTEGMPVESTDGRVGEMADVVIDPVRRRLTHLVVQSGHHHESAHLVPIDAVVSADHDVTLSWSKAEVQSAPLVERTEFIELDEWPQLDDGDIASSRVLAWPYYGLGSVGLDMDVDRGYAPAWTTYDQIPNGTVEIRRNTEVVSVDDHVVGHVDGFVVDPADGLTHIVLDHGHLWGHREITIPMREVLAVVADQVRLRATRDEVGKFPTVAFHRNAS
jgi:uncharacterized protein YrrD